MQISMVDNMEKTFPLVDEEQENTEGQRPIKDFAMVSENDVYKW